MIEQRKIVGKHRHQSVAVTDHLAVLGNALLFVFAGQFRKRVIVELVQALFAQQFIEAGNVAQRKVETLAGYRVQRIRRIADEQAR